MLIYKCEKNIIKTWKWVVCWMRLGQGIENRPLQQFLTRRGLGQVWASQVHFHRPCTSSNQRRRVVMTGCCCQKTLRTFTHTETYAVITQRHTFARKESNWSLSHSILSFSLFARPPSVCLSLLTPKLFPHLCLDLSATLTHRSAHSQEVQKNSCYNSSASPVYRSSTRYTWRSS